MALNGDDIQGNWRLIQDINEQNVAYISSGDDASSSGGAAGASGSTDSEDGEDDEKNGAGGLITGLVVLVFIALILLFANIYLVFCRAAPSGEAKQTEFASVNNDTDKKQENA